jgi:DNA-binding PadR family transcriptional regulator
LAPVIVQRDLGPGEWCVLALLADAPAHGWALAKQMSGTGEIGRVWSMGRPLVYRALELLETRELIRPVGSEPGARGPNRSLFQATAEGREELTNWLSEPVDHVRDVRSLFLLKLVLAERAGLESRPLLEAQRAVTVPSIAALETRLATSVGAEHVFVRFRLESTRSVVFFIDGMLEEGRPPARGTEDRREASSNS